MEFWTYTHRAFIIKFNFNYLKNENYKLIDLEIGLFKWSIKWLIYFKEYKEIVFEPDMEIIS